MDAAERCDLFVAVGTSLVVGPINQMLPAAAASGARTAILTASETPFDAQADWLVGDPLEAVLPRLRDAVQAT
jgi:NAD-dependent deacetylase